VRRRGAEGRKGRGGKGREGKQVRSNIFIRVFSLLGVMEGKCG
jgi:hypothetical protein